MPAHHGHIDVGRSFRLTVQPREDPLKARQETFGTHSIDVTASERCPGPNHSLCDDDVMWDCSQEEVYFQGIRNQRDAPPSIPLIIRRPGFMAILDSFTECWCGILRPLTERWPADTGNGQGGPEPLSQNAP
ncbi:hypothetical protein GCM10010344_30530 [Streptomyces bluensis]|nr:hypothetical protein GCM10010344_30530 [Streptomyces bluensis]